jgi:hypothetical protein
MFLPYCQRPSFTQIVALYILIFKFDLIYSEFKLIGIKLEKVD